MHNTVHAFFNRKEDAVRAVDALIASGITSDEISLILPDEHAANHEGAGSEPHMVQLAPEAPARNAATHPFQHVHRGDNSHPEVPEPPELTPLPTRRTQTYYDDTSTMAAGAAGYTYDELGAVIPDSPRWKRRKSSRRKGAGETKVDTEEGLGLGLFLGMFAALCVPGIGMFVGTGAIVAELMSGGAALGGVAGGIYGYLMDHGVSRGTAKHMSDHLGAGGTTLTITISKTGKEADIIAAIEKFNGRVVELSNDRHDRMTSRV